MTVESTAQPISEWIQEKSTVILMGFLVSVFGYVIIREGINLKILLLSILFLGGMAFWVKDFVRGLFHREVAVYLLIAYLPFSKQIPGHFGGVLLGLNLTNLLVGFITLLWLTGKDEGKRPLLGPTPLNLPIFIFVAFGVFSILRGASYGSSYLAEAAVQYYRKWFVPLYLYFLIGNSVRDKKVIQNIAIIIMMATTMVGLMAIYEYLQTDERVGGVFDQPNQLASFFVYYGFLFFGFFLQNINRFRYWALGLPFLICLRGVMVTFSRAGYFAFAVGLYALACFRSRFMLFLLVIATVFVILNPAFLPEGIRYRLAETIEKRTAESHAVEVQGGSLDESTSDRLKVWEGALAMIREHPVFGIGYYLFESKILHYYTGARPYDPHNTYLLIASEMGVPALVIFFWLVWRIFRNAQSLYKTTRDPFVKALTLGFLGGLFGLLASNVYGSRLTYPEVSSYFWILTALIMRLKKLEEAESL